jgi:heme exporter protein B
MKPFLALLYKETLVELRQRTAAAGLLLYVLGVVFVTGLALRGRVEPATWNVVFWIIVVFAALQTVAKGFLAESEAQQRYLYTLAGPTAIILAKTAYNAALLVALALTAFVLYALLLGYPGQGSVWYFAVAVVLGSLALSAALTLVAAIAGRSGGSQTLMAVLGLPLLVPVLLAMLRMGAAALAGLFVTKDVVLVLSLAALSTAASVILFPYVWRG